VFFCFILKAEGEVDPDFVNHFGDELTPCWNLVDLVSNTEHLVFFNMNMEKPRITYGWQQLRQTYDISEDVVEVMLAYYGKKDFSIHIRKAFNFYISLIPPYHSLHGRYDDSIKFDVVVPRFTDNGVQKVMKFLSILFLS
jgi:hypothetical protein